MADGSFRKIRSGCAVASAGSLLFLLMVDSSASSVIDGEYDNVGNYDCAYKVPL